MQDEDKTHENCLISIAMSMIKNSQGFEVCIHLLAIALQSLVVVIFLNFRTNT